MMISSQRIIAQCRNNLRKQWFSNTTTTLTKPTSTTTTCDASSLDAVAAKTKRLLERKKVTTVDLGIYKKKGKPITMVTAYDYPSSVHVDLAGIDCVLVGDSVGMVELGMDTTLSVTLDTMIHHIQAVKRGATRSLIIGDMPFGSCEGSPYEALKNAQRLLKEGGVDAVKLEGGKERAATVQTIVEGGIAVMGHVGLRPQHISVLGGFRSQGRTAQQAQLILEDALALEKAGAFAVVLECVPAVVAQKITEVLSIPTIGIGAGPYTSGQVLVFHDVLGILEHPHYKQHIPKFCKKYANVGQSIRIGLESFREDVENQRFPSEDYSPFKISEEETKKFLQTVESQYVKSSKSKSSNDDTSEITKVY